MNNAAGKNSLDFVRNFYQLCLNASKQNKYNLILHKHLGDIVYAIAPKKALQTRFNDAPLHFLVRPKHEFVLKMWGYTDYSVVDIDTFIKKNADALSLFDEKSDRQIDVIESGAFISFFSCLPQKDIPFICDSIFFPWHEHKNYWQTRWLKNMEIPENSKCDLPDWYPVLSPEARSRIENIAPLEKIILIAPEAFTAEEFQPLFWEILVRELQKAGYTVIVNSEKIEYVFKETYNTFFLDLSLEDVVALGYACAYVFSLRSGLCDILAGKQEKLYVFYSESIKREFWGLNTLFDVARNIAEIRVLASGIDDIWWEGRNLAIPLKKYLKKAKKRHFINRITNSLKTRGIAGTLKKIYAILDDVITQVTEKPKLKK